MTPAPLGFFCGSSWFGIFLIAQITIFHCRPEIKKSHVLVRGIIVTLAASMFTAALPQSPDWLAVVLRETFATMTVSCLFILYVPFFYSVHTSLSIASLILLMKRGGSAPLAELVTRFASHEPFEARLCTMVESGYLIRSGEQFAPTPRARRVASVFAVVKVLWRLGAGG